MPAGLTLETFAGTAWIGVVPFYLSRLAYRHAPAGLCLSFPELNVRTYVSAEGKPGVWFFSLDAASLLAVLGARATFHLPYYWARMRMHDDAGWTAFASRRRHPGAADVRCVGRYRPVGPIFRATPGSLEEWLTARYCLYAATPTGELLRAEITHAPWPLQPAEGEIVTESLAAAAGIALVGDPLLHYSRRLDIVTWPPERVFA